MSIGGSGHSGHPPDIMDSENAKMERQWLEQRLGNQKHRDFTVCPILATP